MSIFDLLGAAGAGYTRGLAQGEQAKLQHAQQEKTNDFRTQQLQLQKDTLDLQKLRTQQEAERALKEGGDRQRELYTKAALAGLDFYRDPKNSANHDATIAKVGGPSAFQMQQQFQEVLQRIAAGDDLGKIKFPAPRLLEKIAAHDNAVQLQGAGSYGPNAVSNVNVGSAASDFQQPGPDWINRVGSLPEIPNLRPDLRPVQQEGLNVVPSIVPQPGLIPQPPGEAADIAFKKQQAGTSASTQAYNEARTKTERIKQENQRKADEALIHQREGAAKFSNAQAAALPTRVGTDQARAAEQARHNKETEAQARAETARKAAADQVEAALKRAQVKKTLADWQKVKDGLGKIAKTTQLDPADKAEFQYLQKNATSTSKITGKVQPTPGYNERMEAFLKKVREKYGTKAATATTTETAPTTPAAGMPSKLNDFFPDDVAEVKRNLRNFDSWVNTLSPELQDTAKAIRGLMR